MYGFGLRNYYTKLLLIFKSFMLDEWSYSSIYSLHSSNSTCLFESLSKFSISIIIGLLKPFIFIITTVP